MLKVQKSNLKTSVSPLFVFFLHWRYAPLFVLHALTPTQLRESETIENKTSWRTPLPSEAIPEENYTKSLPERDKHGGGIGAGGGGGGSGSTAGGAGIGAGAAAAAALRRGPALIKASGTPKPANGGRKSTNPATTALLSSSSTDSEEDDDEDEDCGDEQHPIWEIFI